MKKYLLFLLLSSLVVLSSLAVEPGEVCRISLVGRSLFVENGATGNAPIVLWKETRVQAQRWIFIAEEDYFAFENVWSGKRLAFSGARRAGVKVVQRAGTSSATQWQLIPVDGKANQWYIVQSSSSAEDLYMAALGKGDGAAVQLVSEEDAKADPSLSVWTIEEANDVEFSFNEIVRDEMIDGFLGHYCHTAGTGHVLGNGGWWGDAEMFETILDAFETTGDQRYKTEFEQLYRNFVQRNGTDWSYNEYNDDITWMVLACIRAYKYFGTSAYRSYAKSNFDRMYKRAQCYPEGMLRWKQGNNGTNSCINGPAIVAACYLFEILGDSAYLDKAKATYYGQRNNLFKASDGHVYDSGEWKDDKFQVNNTWCSTYNQGTMLGAAIMLWQHTGQTQYRTDAERIWQYSYKNLTESTNHIIHVCQTVSGDLCGFKGIFMRYARHYAEDLDHPNTLDWIAKNAYYAYQNRNSAGVTWSKWLTKTAENFKDGDTDIRNDAFGASTAVSAAANAHINGTFYKDAFEFIGVNAFDDICFMQIDGKEMDEDRPATTVANKEGAFICFKNVRFGSSISSQLLLRANAGNAASSVSICLDGPGDECCVARVDSLPQGWSTIVFDIPEITGQHSVYVKLPKAGKVAFSGLQFIDATFIASQNVDGEEKNTLTTYNVAGIPALHSPKGIVISNGKKILIR